MDSVDPNFCSIDELFSYNQCHQTFILNVWILFYRVRVSWDPVELGSVHVVGAPEDTEWRRRRRTRNERSVHENSQLHPTIQSLQEQRNYSSSQRVCIKYVCCVSLECCISIFEYKLYIMFLIPNGFDCFRSLGIIFYHTPTVNWPLTI